MATLKFLDPRGTVNPKDRPLVPGLETLAGKVIGIIDNGQSNSTDMFKELAQLTKAGAKRFSDEKFVDQLRQAQQSRSARA